jgi:hypothetical protein
MSRRSPVAMPVSISIGPQAVPGPPGPGVPSSRRIDMPNRHAVYLHDTPSKSLFSRDVRFHSSGCVRAVSVDQSTAVGWTSLPCPSSMRMCILAR